jgi:hypothetical protein
MSEFGDAFAKARKKFEKSGNESDYTFEHKGKKYTVRKKGESKGKLMERFGSNSGTTRPKPRPSSAPESSTRPRSRPSSAPDRSPRPPRRDESKVPVAEDASSPGPIKASRLPGPLVRRAERAIEEADSAARKRRIKKIMEEFDDQYNEMKESLPSRSIAELIGRELERGGPSRSIAQIIGDAMSGKAENADPNANDPRRGRRGMARGGMAKKKYDPVGASRPPTQKSSKKK